MSPRTLIALAALTCSLPALAGPMTPPPGAPAATMKTLAEVEPRIAINATNTPGDADSVFKITQPGSYYLTGNLTGAPSKMTIQIEADDVTVDLNGFAMIGAGASGRAIGGHGDDERPDNKNIRIANGSMSGNSYGILSSNMTSVSIENVAFSGGYAGVSLTNFTTISHCTFSGHTGAGLELDGVGTLVNDCIFASCGLGLYGTHTRVENSLFRACTDGISLYHGSATDCIVSESSGEGITLNFGSTAERCTVTNSGTGIDTIAFYTVVRDCTVRNTTGDGIRIGGGSASVTGNRVTYAGSAGIRLLSDAAKCHVEGNEGSDNLTGLYVSSTNCTIIRNTFGRNSNPANSTYFIAPGNRYGAIVKMSTNGANTFASSSGATVPGTFTASDPFANLTY